MGLNDPLPGRAKDYSADFGRILGLGTVTVHLDTVHITLEHDELVLLDVKLPPNELLSTVGKVRLENVTKYRRVYDSGVSQYLTWLTFRIAQHFAVPLLPGIPQPGKDAPPLRFPHPQDHSSLKLRWVDVTNSCPESFNISIPSLPFVVSLLDNLGSPLPVANVITSCKHYHSSLLSIFNPTLVFIWWPLSIPQSLVQRETQPNTDHHFQ